MGQRGMDVFEDGDNEAYVSTGLGDERLLIAGWMQSHADLGGWGPHVALRLGGHRGGPPLVIHAARVPAFVAALTEVALRMTQAWERDGASYSAGHSPAAEASAHDPAGVSTDAPEVGDADQEDARRQRRAAKQELLELVYTHAPDVLACVLAAEDDDDAAAALAHLLGVSLERTTELITHLQFRELTKAARRRVRSG